MTVTQAWQVLALLAAGGMLTVGILLWVVGRFAPPDPEGAGGCLARLMVLVPFACGIAILVMALAT